MFLESAERLVRNVLSGILEFNFHIGRTELRDISFHAEVRACRLGRFRIYRQIMTAGKASAPVSGAVIFIREGRLGKLRFWLPR